MVDLALFSYRVYLVISVLFIKQFNIPPEIWDFIFIIYKFSSIFDSLSALDLLIHPSVYLHITIMLYEFQSLGMF